MKVVSFSIFKGGTGKTTSTVNTAASLVKKGKRLLLVDLDQQASATRLTAITFSERHLSEIVGKNERGIDDLVGADRLPYYSTESKK